MNGPPGYTAGWTWGPQAAKATFPLLPNFTARTGLLAMPSSKVKMSSPPWLLM